MSTALKTTEQLKERWDQIQKVGDGFRGALSVGASQGSISVDMALAVAQLRSLITDEMVQTIMPLMNSPLGFKTDSGKEDSKRPTPYGIDVVREVWIIAELTGARMTGNETNIIAGNAYFTKEFYDRIVRETDGINDIDIICGHPEIRTGYAKIPVVVLFRLHDVPHKYTCDAIVEIKGSPTISNLHGKAEKFALERLADKLRRGKVLPIAGGSEGQVLHAEFRQIDPREVENDRQAARDASRAHAASEGSQVDPELNGPDLAALFVKTINEAETLMEMEGIRIELKRAATENRIARELSSQTWSVFHARVKELEKAGK